MSDKKIYQYYARMSSAVLLKVLLGAGGFFLGRSLDERYGTDPYLMFAGFVLGISLGLWWVIRNANRP